MTLLQAHILLALFQVIKLLARGKPQFVQALVSTIPEKNAPRNLGNWDADSAPILIDSGSSASLTPYKGDLRQARPYNTKVTWLGAGSITHVGKVSWCVQDTKGNNVYIMDDVCYYCPQAPYRILSPQSWKKAQDRRQFALGETSGDQATFLLSPVEGQDEYMLAWNRSRTQVICPIDPVLNLPIIKAVSSYCVFSAFAQAFRTFPAVIEDDEDEESSTPPESGEHDSQGDNDNDPINGPATTERKKSFTESSSLRQPVTSIDDPLTHRDEDLFCPGI